MLTELQRKKLPLMFALNDRNGDGVVTKQDYEQTAQILARIGGVSAGTPEYEHIRSTIMSFWNDVHAKADKDGDDRITLQEWIKYWNELLAVEEEYDRVYRSFSVIVARTLDKNGDGRIAPEEFTESLIQCGVDDNAASDCFRHFDVNGDGYISQDEYVAGVREYFYSSDPDSPGNWLFGPLKL